MKENISVEATCCTHSLNDTLPLCHSLVLFLRGCHALPHLGKQLLTARRTMSGGILVYGRVQTRKPRMAAPVSFSGC